MQIAILMALYFAMRGLNAFFVKKAQPAQSTIRQTLIFTTVFSLFQAISLLAFPPFSLKAFTPSLLMYSCLYAVFFILAYIFFFRAMLQGSVGVSNAIFSFYVVVPIVAGLFLWDESLSVTKVIGILMFLGSVLIFNKGTSKQENQHKKQIGAKWLISILLATLCSGVGVIFTRECMRANPGYDKEYLICFNLFVVLIGIVPLACRLKDFKACISVKGFTANSFFAAITQNVNNIIFILYLNKVESALFLPLIGIINILSVIAAGRLFFKEKISPTAFAAVILSAASLCILNI